ncbi:MAG TPA: hypothetical protein VFX25_14800 [Streptosporangiaceae bacterium]|nr:hypothetical protein [Streptosporangiaceae bacterium]
MAYNPSAGSNNAFTSGVLHNVNQDAHTNAFAIGDDARSDQGLADTSARWDTRGLYSAAMNPTAGGTQDDAAYQAMMRTQGDYQPTD